MEDFLYRLFKLTRSMRQLPVENFLSLCLGHLLERDIEARRALLKVVDERFGPPSGNGKAQRSWTALAERARVRAQVSEKTPRGDTAIADLVIDFEARAPVPPHQIVLEAKVGRYYPTEVQISKYRQAFAGALVAPLVEARAAGDSPALTWQDVHHALSVGPPDLPEYISQERRDFIRLLADTGVINPRSRGAALPFGHTPAQLADLRTEVRRWLVGVLLSVAKNADVRAKIENEHWKDRDGDWELAADGWGAGLIRPRALSGTQVRGLVLAVDTSFTPDTLIWRLELLPTSRARAALHVAEPRWRRVRGFNGWYTIDLHTSSTKAPFDTDQVGALRGALCAALKSAGLLLTADKRKSPWKLQSDTVAPLDSNPAQLASALEAWEPTTAVLRELRWQTAEALRAKLYAKRRPAVLLGEAKCYLPAQDSLPTVSVSISPGLDALICVRGGKTTRNAIFPLNETNWNHAATATAAADHFVRKLFSK